MDGQPREEDFDQLIEATLARLARTRQSRPPWWREPSDRDEAALERDVAGSGRDEAADRRDEAADWADRQASARERAAAESVAAAHGRLDAADVEDVRALSGAVTVGQEIEGTFAALRSLPGAPQQKLARALELIELHLDHVYATLVRAGVDRDQARTDLRNIAQHLGAAAAERHAAAENRAAAAGDRQAARSDRGRSETDRQQSAIQRAPRVEDV